MKYIIEKTYKATIVVEVEANDEGEALSKSSDIAEEADINEFSITDELESSIINTI